MINRNVAAAYSSQLGAMLFVCGRLNDGVAPELSWWAVEGCNEYQCRRNDASVHAGTRPTRNPK